MQIERLPFLRMDLNHILRKEAFYYEWLRVHYIHVEQIDHLIYIL